MFKLTAAPFMLLELYDDNCGLIATSPRFQKVYTFQTDINISNQISSGRPLAVSCLRMIRIYGLYKVGAEPTGYGNPLLSSLRQYQSLMLCVTLVYNKPNPVVHCTREHRPVSYRLSVRNYMKLILMDVSGNDTFLNSNIAYKKINRLTRCWVKPSSEQEYNRI